MGLRYAVKIGEIHLRSDKPITEEMRLAILKELMTIGFNDEVEIAAGVRLTSTIVVGTAEISS